MRTFGKGNVWVPVFAQIDLKKATVRIKDGSSNSITVKIGEGNLTYTEKKTMEYTLDRGLLDEVREGDEVPIDVKLDAVWEYISGTSGSAGIASIEDALKRRGAAAAWVSTDADACRPYAVDIEIEYLPTPSTCGDKEVITLSDYRYEQLDHDLRAGTISTSGKCNVNEATAVRSAQSS